MDESKQHAVEFLEKEIKTYMALSLFLSKRTVREHLGSEEKRNLINPPFYEERIKEAKKLAYELKKQN